MYSGGISWSDLNPFDYEACIGDYCTDLETIAVTAKETVDAAPGAIADGVKTVYDFYAEKPAMLPAIVFGWPFMLLGAGCTNKGSGPSAPRITLNFDESDNPPAYKLYQSLLREGVAQSDIDKGYNVINFDGKYCAVQDEKSCTKGANDLKIDSQEVFEYALNNYERFRNLIEATLGHPLPWVLDDLNPETTFDEEIRTKVTNAINTIKVILTTQGLSEESETYKEHMAVGLLWFAALPQEQISTNTFIYPFMKERIEKAGLNEFVNYLAQNGGLRISSTSRPEFTALEALQNENGDCTEFAKILFAVLKMANLDPQFMTVEIKLSDINNLLGPAELRNQVTRDSEEQLASSPSLNHVCLALPAGEHIRLFDSMFFQDDAGYQTYWPSSLRQFLSNIYSNESINLSPDETSEARSNFEDAIALDPMNALAYLNLGMNFIVSNSPDNAISALTHAVEIYPSLPTPYYERGIAWLLKGDSRNAIGDFSQFLRSGPEYVGSVSGVINLIISKKWQNRRETTLFSEETSLVLPNVENFLLKTGLAWNIGDKAGARSHLNIISESLNVTKTPSDFTKQFFESMFQLMPPDMQQDAEVAEMIATIRRKLAAAQ